MTRLSDNEMVALFTQHLKLLKEECDDALAHITASREMIEQSRVLIVQLDEQLDRMQRELGWFGDLPQSGSPFAPPEQPLFAKTTAR